jgi:hypothetical protein
MSRTTAPLSDSACRSAKPTDRAYKLFDGDGLYLLVQPNGRKGWRLRYVKPDGREGPHSVTTLSLALPMCAASAWRSSECWRMALIP